MDEGASRPTIRIDRVFAGPGARADQWYRLVELAESWTRGSTDRAVFELALAELMATEEFHAYPGFKLMTALRDAAAAGDACATATLVRRITRALVTRSFRQNAGDWESHEDGEGVGQTTLHPALAPIRIAHTLPRARFPGSAIPSPTQLKTRC